MCRLTHQKRLNIRALARNRHPSVIVALKGISLDAKEHMSVRKEAIAALGSFGRLAIEPLTEVILTTKDNNKKMSKCAFSLLHALNQSEQSNKWDAETRLKLNAAVWACAGLIEGLV
jgi:hypothetical protein